MTFLVIFLVGFAACFLAVFLIMYVGEVAQLRSAGAMLGAALALRVPRVSTAYDLGSSEPQIVEATELRAAALPSGVSDLAIGGPERSPKSDIEVARPSIVWRPLVPAFVLLAVVNSNPQPSGAAHRRTLPCQGEAITWSGVETGGASS